MNFGLNVCSRGRLQFISISFGGKYCIRGEKIPEDLRAFAAVRIRWDMNVLVPDLEGNQKGERDVRGGETGLAWGIGRVDRVL